MTREEAIEWMHKEVPAEILLERIYDDFDAKHRYIIELIAHTAGSGNKAISQTLLTIDGILKEMREQK